MNGHRVNRFFLAIWTMLNLAGGQTASADVHADGSLNAGEIEFKNGVYHIDATTKGAFSRNGRNVFFSFDQFKVEQNNTALFYCGGGCGAARNVVSRITAADGATIDGTLKSTIGGADGHFFMLSPNGVIFGKNAVLDVPGVAHISTARSLRFDDGKTFNAAVTPGEEVSSLTADPTHFGFLARRTEGSGHRAGVVSVEGLQVESGKLQVSADMVETGSGTLSAGPNASTIEIVGNRIVVRGTVESAATVDDPETRSAPAVNILAGNLPVDGTAPDVPADSGAVEVSEGGQVLAGNSGTLNVGSGRASSRVGFSDVNAQRVNSLSAHRVELKDGAAVDKTAGGSARIDAKNILVDGGARISTAPPVTGNLTVDATGDDPPGTGDKALTVRNGGEIAAGNRGALTVVASGATSSVQVSTYGEVTGGNAGDMNVGWTDSLDRAKVSSRQVHVSGGGAIAKTADGDLEIEGETVLVEGAESKLTVAAGVTGHARVAGNGVTVRNRGAIAGHHSGDLEVAVTDQGKVDVDNGRIEGANRGTLRVGPDEPGTTGSIRVANVGTVAKTSEGDLELRSGSLLVEGSGSAVSASESSAGTLRLEATGADPAGDDAAPRALTLRNGGTVAARQVGDAEIHTSGAAPGTLSVESSGSVQASNGGKLDLASGEGSARGTIRVQSGGTVRKTAGESLSLKGRSILVDGAGSAVEASQDGVGTFSAAAVGGDVEVRGGGRLAGANSGDTLVAADSGTIRLASGGSIEKTAGRAGSKFALNAGNVDLDGPSTTARATAGHRGDSDISAGDNVRLGRDARMEFANGGNVTIQGGGNLDVAGTIDNRNGGTQAIAAGTDLTVTGRVANSGAGAATATARNALKVAEGGQLEKTGSGDFSITGNTITVSGTSNAGKSRIAKSGRGSLNLKAQQLISLSGSGALEAKNNGDVDMRAPTIKLVGNGSDQDWKSPPKPGEAVVVVANRGNATFRANRINGEKRAIVSAVGVNSWGDLVFKSLSGESLSIDPLWVVKTTPGNIEFSGARTISLDQTYVRLDSRGSDGGNIFLGARGPKDRANTLEEIKLTRSMITNTGSGGARDTNSIRFNLRDDVLQPRVVAIHSIIETRTGRNGGGGRIDIVPAGTRISYGTGGRGEWTVIPEGELVNTNYFFSNKSLYPTDSTLTVFATSHESKFSPNITLSSTASLQAASLAVIASAVSNIDPDTVRSNPCGKGGSSLSLAGQSGYPAEPSVALQLPMPGETAAAVAAETGFGSAEPLRLAALQVPRDEECN